jgi:mono/diheme cytochrome c family protein
MNIGARLVGRACLLALSIGLCSGCMRVTNDMADQPRYNPDSASELFANTQATRAPPAGSVARAAGDEAAIAGGHAASAGDSSLVRPALTAALVKRGADRYTIYCMPCHGAHGDGAGEVVRRGFPAPPKLWNNAFVSADDSHLHDVIRQGQGIMYPFADRVSDSDAWAIVEYLRSMQRAPEASSRLESMR